ncbi:MAG: T9SS type A sorting domain-containing protein, partial [FCB group bacterium]|nr:T9SS type A sorting domain-containing protein [FCB group bacterium]
SLPLLSIESADSTVIRGFLFDRSGNDAGELSVKHSRGVLIDGAHLRGCRLSMIASGVFLRNLQHYGALFDDKPAVDLQQSDMVCENVLWRDHRVHALLSGGSGSSFSAVNHIIYNNQCSGNLFDIAGVSFEIGFSTFYNNISSLSPWEANASAVEIKNSVLCHLPPNDPEQFLVRYSSLPGNYPGTGNISADPQIDVSSTYPKLYAHSPCIAAADPDTSGIPRFDFFGNPRPNPAWSPPDMGAYESARHVPLNIGNRFWVDPLGCDTWGNGTSDLPYATVQTAADNALAGDTLLLRPGMYRGNVAVHNKALTIASTFLLSGDTAQIPLTVLLGDTSVYAPVLQVTNTDSFSLSGLTIREGRGRYIYNNYTFGGGLYTENSICRIRNVVFGDNRADFSGGALYAQGSNILMDRVRFLNNAAYLGGAMAFSNTTAHMSHIAVYGNVASSGGGIYAENNSSVVLFYADISHNHANTDSLIVRLMKPSAISQYGGGIYATTSSDVRLHNTLLSRNHAKNKGAAIAARSGQIDIVQSTIAGHASEADSSGILFLQDQQDLSTILNTIIWNPEEIQIECSNSKLAIVHTNLLGGSGAILHRYPPTALTVTSILDADPLFVASYDINAASPCRGAGTATYATGGYYLINYDPEHYGGTAPDIGHLGAVPPVRFEKETVPVSVLHILESSDVLEVFPNPFNPDTRLSFRLSEAGSVGIDIYDLRGRHLRSVLNTYLSEGAHSVIFHTGDLPAGLYLCRLHRQGKTLATNKLVLLK